MVSSTDGHIASEAPELAEACLDTTQAHPEMQRLPKAMWLSKKQDWQWICFE